VSDRVFFATCAAVAVVLVLVALIWPQGLGTRSPPPFGHPELQPAPAQPSKTPIR
jgi:hypothetical protein